MPAVQKTPLPREKLQRACRTESRVRRRKEHRNSFCMTHFPVHAALPQVNRPDACHVRGLRAIIRYAKPVPPAFPVTFLMADYTKFDPRVDSLVMETRTLWDPSVGKLSEEDQIWLAKMVHAAPQKATKVEYDRSHTGFTRTITVTAEDIARIYQEKVAT